MHVMSQDVNPFELPPVIHEICKSLPTADLLRCSFLSQTWLLSCRIVLRDCKPSIFRTAPGKACVRLKDFEVALRQQSLPFINGISITVTSDNHSRRSWCWYSHETTVGANVGDIFYSTLKLKYIEIKWLGESRNEWNCPAVRLVQKCIQERPQDIVYLKLEHMPRKFRLFPPNSELNFPNLRTFKSGLRHERIFGLLTKRLLMEGAPNLEEYDVPLTKKDLKIDKFPQDRLRTLKNVHFETGCSTAPLIQYEKMVEVQTKLNTLHAVAPEFKRLPMLFRGWECLRQLLDNSVNSLTKIRVQALVALMLEDLRAGPFRNVRDLSVEVPLSENGTNLRNAMTCFNFSALFPAAINIKVFPQSVYRGDFNHNFYNKFHTDRQGCSAGADAINGGINKVELGYATLNPMVPEMRKIFSSSVNTVEAVSSKEIPNLWTWPGLKFAILVQRTMENLDGKFCGIYPAEAHWLRNESDEFLMAYHVVPLWEPIYYNTSLEKFTVQCLGRFYGDLGAFSILTKVTKLLALRRITRSAFEVVVQCHRDVARALGHLNGIARIEIKNGLGRLPNI